MFTILVANGDSSKAPPSFPQGVQLATAKANPEALAAQIEEVNPELLVISFAFNALPLTRFLSSKFTSLKIFLTEAPSCRDLIEALKAGACGITLKGATEEELKLAVSATLKECLLIGPSGEVKFIVYPQPNKIKRFERWLDWLAQNVINSWRSSPCPSSPEAFFDAVGIGESLDLLDSLGKGVKLSFKEELKRIIDNFDASPSEFIDTLEKAENILNSWLYNVASEESCLARIKNNALLCQRETKLKMREFLKSLDGGTLACRNWLEQAQTGLRRVVQKVEQARVRESEKEKSATRAYRQLVEQVKVSDSKLDFESAKRALLISYQSILSKNINDVGLVIIKQISQELESYRQVVGESDRLLYDIQNSLFERSAAPNPMFAALWQDYCLENLNALQVLQKIEQWIGGVSIKHWGEQKINRGALREKMLEVLRPQALKLYLECHQEILL